MQNSNMISIAIIGGGPVGCTLARLLLKSSISSQVSVQVFEKDKSRISRHSLGGCLDLHPPTGLAALQAMGLWDEFQKFARYDGEELRISDCNGMVYVHMTSAPVESEARPEINREKLMDIVMQGVLDLSPDCVHWDKGVKQVTPNGERWTVHFDDNSAQDFDLVVGADGAWSKVRGALTTVTPDYAGVCYCTGTVTKESAGENWDKISSMAGKGSHFTSSHGQSFALQRLDDGSLKTAFSFKRSLEWAKNFKTMYTNDEALRSAILREAQSVGWTTAYQNWITASTKMWSQPLWEFPVGHRFDHKKGVTVIGDAAHLMTPYAGEGVNAGMRDALDLFKAIENALQTGGSVDEAIHTFEEDMFVRMHEFMSDTYRNKQGFFGADAPVGLLANMTYQIARGVTGRDMSSGWGSWALSPFRNGLYALLWTMGAWGAFRRRLTGTC